MTSVSTDRRFGVNAGSALKVPVKVASTATLTLSGEQTVDGVALVTGDRVLVKNQTDATANGIYQVDSGIWSRTPDFDGTYDAVHGTVVHVVSGSTYANTWFEVSTSNPFTIGTSSIVFAQTLLGDAGTVSFTQSGTGAVTKTVQAELRETRKASQFGAVGDAATDNAATFALAFAALSSGDVLEFTPGTYKTTSPLPIKDGITLRGSGPGQVIINYVEQNAATMFDDGNTAMTVQASGITFRRSGSGAALAGATGSARYTVRLRHASTVFKFFNCILDDSNWNITDGALDALTAVSNEGGSSYFLNCSIGNPTASTTGRGIFMAGGNNWFIGEMNVSVKCFACHGGTARADGHFKATGATGSDGVISVADATAVLYINGDFIRTVATSGKGIYCAGGTVYATGSINSSGQGINTADATATVDFTGNIKAASGNALRNDGGELRASGVFESSGTVAIVATTGTTTVDGVVKATGAFDGVFMTGGNVYFNGSMDVGGSAWTQSAGVGWMNGHFRSTLSGVNISGGSLKIDGRIETPVHGILPTGATAKTIDIGNLDINLTGSTARVGIGYTTSTNNTTTASSLRITAATGAAASVTTGAANAQTITAGQLVSNVSVGDGISVVPFNTRHPWDTDVVKQFDDFLGDVLADQWNTRVGSDGACVAAAILANQARGLFRATTGAGAGATYAVNGTQLDSQLNWQANQGGLTCEFRVLLSAITNVALYIGLTDQVAALEMPFTLAAGDVLTSNASDAVGVLFDTGADTDNWWLVGVKADVDAAKQNTGVAPTAGTMETWRIDVTSAGAASFYRNGTLVGVALANALTTTVALTPVVAAFARAAASRNLDGDFVLVQANR